MVSSTAYAQPPTLDWAIDAQHPGFGQGWWMNPKVVQRPRHQTLKLCKVVDGSQLVAATLRPLSGVLVPIDNRGRVESASHLPRHALGVRL